jgi:hypothetical protein
MPSQEYNIGELSPTVQRYPLIMPAPPQACASVSALTKRSVLASVRLR